MSLSVCLACSQTLYKKKPLKYQVLIIHPAYPGQLVNQIINQKEKRLTTYDLENKDFRELANKLHISCKMGKELYFICPNKPGFCRRTLNCLKWKRKIFKKYCIQYEIEYLDSINDFNLLLEGQMECSIYDAHK